MSRTGRKLRIGVAGLGRAFSIMLPALTDPRVELVAAADPREEARRRFTSQFHAKTYPSVDALLDNQDVEVLYIATPHQFHAEHARLAAARGKHILVEKPMALSLEDCRLMIAAARTAGVHLIVGHSHSFDSPILRAREIIEGGDVGRVRMISALNFTDFLYRPRRPEELDTAQGGGVVFNQAAHHVDIVRLLGGGRLRSVRAATGEWDRARPTEGAYACFMTFEDGTFATLSYSGYAHFDSDEACEWVSELGASKDPAKYGVARRLLRQARDETEVKASRNYGAQESMPGKAVAHQHFGMVIASCEKADLRPLPSGVMIYGDSERRLDALPAPAVPRSEVIDEIYDAVVDARPPLHNGEWALATMEACLAILASAREGKEVILENQIALPKR